MFAHRSLEPIHLFAIACNDRGGPYCPGATGIRLLVDRVKSRRRQEPYNERVCSVHGEHLVHDQRRSSKKCNFVRIALQHVIDLTGRHNLQLGLGKAEGGAAWRHPFPRWPDSCDACWT